MKNDPSFFAKVQLLSSDRPLLEEFLDKHNHEAAFVVEMQSLFIELRKQIKKNFRFHSRGPYWISVLNAY